MAPITEEVAQSLLDTVNRLEARLQQVEARLEGRDSSSSPSESMRMILMGPPGAGKLNSQATVAPRAYIHELTASQFAGKGTQAPRIKEKYGCCHLVRDFDSVYTLPN